MSLGGFGPTGKSRRRSSPSPLFVARAATLDPTRQYRYSLTRTWDVGRPVLWIMLNPSVADADHDDPTIRRCMDFAARWGYPGIEVVNLFAYRATDPDALVTVQDPVGPGNDLAIAGAASRAGLLVAAWGAFAHHHDRAQTVLALLRCYAMHALGFTKGGHPRHPLFVAGSTSPTVWTPTPTTPSRRPD